VHLLTYRSRSTDFAGFVKFWEARYNYGDDLLYDQNIGQPIGTETVRKLFTWKNGSVLSKRKSASIKKNYLDRLDALSASEQSKSAEELLGQFNKGGAVWRIFWLHCWKPEQFPIFDQHVYRAMRFIKSHTVEEIPSADARKIEIYVNEYIPFHQQFSEMHFRQVDKALWAFGKFTKTYKF
jgi:hypothetical protein